MVTNLGRFGIAESDHLKADLDLKSVAFRFKMLMILQRKHIAARWSGVGCILPAAVSSRPIEAACIENSWRIGN